LEQHPTHVRTHNAAKCIQYTDRPKFVTTRVRSAENRQKANHRDSSVYVVQTGIRGSGSTRDARHSFEIRGRNSQTGHLHKLASYQGISETVPHPLVDDFAAVGAPHPPADEEALEPRPRRPEDTAEKPSSPPAALAASTWSAQLEETFGWVGLFWGLFLSAGPLAFLAG